ncbi:MAG: DUF47 family protein, partial [Planctomycetes bacterium]|nr:DUF47 family protein [Planctomycetota bacterium]
ELWGHFEPFLGKSLECFQRVRKIIEELDELVETGFGGAEAESVRRMVDEVALAEHETDLLQRELMKCLFAAEGSLTHGEFILWMRLAAQVANISDYSENLADTIRLTLESK